MKPIHTTLIFIACLAFSSVSAQSQINCGLLPGNWSGEHTDSQGNYSRWTGSYSNNGNLALTFFDANGTQASTQAGLWECTGATLSTAMVSGDEKLEYDYDILSLDQTNLSYRSHYNGTVFNSRRLSD